jgi:hypothetical protein
MTSPEESRRGKSAKPPSGIDPDEYTLRAYIYALDHPEEMDAEIKAVEKRTAKRSKPRDK